MSLPSATPLHATTPLQATDEFGNASEVFEFSFILDTTAPTQPTATLHALSDTGMQGDFKTAASSVTLVGQTEANMWVTLEQTGVRTISDSTGRFEFTEVALNFGTNQFTLRSTDIAGNESTATTTLTRLQAPIALALDHTLVAENSPADTVIGRFRTIDPDLGDRHTYTLTSSAAGRFQIVGDTLQVAPGAVLDFEGTQTYSIEVVSTDADGLSRSQTFEIGITNVNEAPRFTSNPLLTGQGGTPYLYDIGTIDPDAGDTRRITATGLPSGLTLVDRGDGTAMLQGLLATGTHRVNLTVEDAGGLTHVQSFIIGVSPEPLVEGTNFTATRTVTLQTPSTPSILSFKMSPTFDGADQNSIKDAFEVALVDGEGNSLVHSIVQSRDSFFNWTEGEAIVKGAGVTYDALTGEVKLNLVGVPAGKAATLIFRLVNNDNDITTRVVITDLQVSPAPAGTVAPQGSFAALLPVGGRPSFSQLTDVSPSFRPEYGQTSFNADTNLLYADIAIRNVGSYSVNAPLLVAVTGISDPSVTVREPDGFTPDGTPYYDLSRWVKDGKLNPEQVSDRRSLIFYNPNGIQFDYQLKVLSQLNQSPIIQSQPIAEIIKGQAYQYEVKAIDPNQDSLRYKLMVAPQGMAINEQTGVITWNTTEQAIGSYIITVEVTDERGGIAQQQYNLSVIETPPNRPPIFTTTPIVDAAVNKSYLYDANAIDPDQDSVNYSLGFGPEGMTVDPITGEVKWKPPAAMVFGDTVLGRINNPAEQDVYTFNGIEGQRIYFDSLRYSGGQRDWSVKIYSPSGVLLINSNMSFEGPFNLTETGNYRVVIRTIGSASGDYGFSLIDLGNVPVAEFDSNISGSLTPGSEDDLYRFSGNAGQQLFFDQLSSYSNLDWVLYGGDNQVLWTQSWTDGEYTLPADGEYILALRGRNSFSTKGNYTFRIITPDFQTASLSLGDNATPNPIQSSISEKGEQDTYTFTGTVGQRIYFDHLLDTASSWTLSAKLYSPTGELVLARNFTSGDADPITLIEDGVYRLVIDASGESLGEYGFSLLNAGLATPISLDSEVRGAISSYLNSGRETHLYEFDGNANQRLYFDNLIAASGLNWTLYGAGNQRLNSSNMSTTGSDFEVTLPNTGKYLLAIQGQSATPLDYRFKLLTPEIHSDVLSFDTTISRSITEKGETDIYTLMGTANQRVFLDSLIDSPTLTAQLISPSGSILINGGIYADRWRQPVILPESGLYRLVVDGSGETTENYSFRLANLSTAPTIPMETVTTSSLNPGSEIDVYQFTGNGGDRLYLDSQFTSSPATWILYGPGNQVVNSATLNQDFEVVLPSSGTYYLVLRGDGNTTVIDYKIQLVPSLQPVSESLALNTWMNGTIAKLGEQDIYTFTANKDQRIYFDPRRGNSNIAIRIESPSGVILFNGNMGTDGSPLTLVESGSYRVRVDGNNDEIGDYGFRLIDTNTITTLSTATATGSQTLAPLETTLYRIQGIAGQRIKLDSLLVTGNAVWALYAPGHQPTRREVIGTTSLNNDFEVVLPVSGNYLLALQNQSTTPAQFNIQITDLTDSPVIPSGLGTIYTGSIGVGEVKRHTFAANAGTFVLFDNLESSDNWIGLRLRDPSNAIVFDGHWIRNGDRAPIQLTKSGTYTVEFYGSGGTWTGNYRFQALDFSAGTALALNTVTNVTLGGNNTRIYQFSGSVGQKILYDALNSNANASTRLISPSGRLIFNAAQSDQSLLTLDEVGNYYLLLSNNQASATIVSFQLLDNVGATAIGLDTNIPGTLANLVETDLYRFNGTQGQALYLDSQTQSTWPPHYWMLYGPGGQQITNSYLSNDAEFTLPGTGEYLVAIQGGGTNPSAYQFRLVNPTLSISQPLSIGTTLQNRLDKYGEQDVYTFDGTTGQRLFFDGIEGNSINVRLVSPSGLSVFGSPWGPVDIAANSNSGLFTLSETGTYRVIVDGSGETIGNYSFRFLDAAVATAVSLDAVITQNVATNRTELLQFMGSANQAIYFANTATNGGRWQIFTPDNQDIAGFAWGDIERTLATTGTYTIALHNSGSGISSYQLQGVTSITTTVDLSMGETIAATISEMGEKDVYTFTGTVGQRVLLDSLIGNWNFGLSITSPSGQRIYNLDLTREQGPLTLLESGTYQITVDGNGRETGNYSFRLLDLADASELSLDQAIIGNLPRATERQMYQFRGTAGQHLYFDKSQNWSNRANWVLYGPGNQVVVAPPWWLADMEVRLPGNGTYTLVIGGSVNVDTAEPYQFQVITPQTTTAAMDVGSTMTGRLNEAGEQHIYMFTATQGQRFYLDKLAGNGSINVELYSPSNSQVTFDNSNTDRGPFFIRETGTYRLVIDGSYDATGNYGFRLVDLESAPVLALDTLVEKTLSPGHSVDFYKFQGAAGQQILFDAITPQTWDIDWILYDEGNQTLANTSWNGRWGSPDFELKLPRDGAYTLAVRSFTAIPINYSFQAVTPIITQKPINLGEVTTGAITEAGERDEFVFKGTVGQKVWFDSLSSSSGISGRLISPTGVETQEYSVSSDWSPITLVESGSYRLVIDGNGTATGDYSFKLADLNQTTPLQLAIPAEGSLGRGNERVLYQFTGSVGQRLNFDWQSSTWNGMRWTLYAPNNQEIITPRSADFDVLLPAKGVYTLAIAGNGSSAANYRFTVADTTPTAITPSALGVVYQGGITTGKTDSYTFSGNAGTRIYLDSLDVDQDAVEIQLLNPDNTSVFRMNASSDRSFFILAQTGTYTLRVQGSNSSATGDYRFRLLELPSETPDPRGNENSLQMGVITSRSIEGRAAEIYSFTGKVGQTILLDGMMPPIGGAGSVRVQLISPQGTELINNGNQQGWATSDVGLLTLRESGTYNVIFSSEQDTPTSYRFRLLDAAEAKPIEMNKQVADNLQPGSATNLYRFNGTTGQRLFIDSVSGINSATWALYRPGNQAIVTGTNPISDFEAVLPVDGEYILAIAGYNNTTLTSTYQFRVVDPKNGSSGILTPGDGETGSADGNELGTYQVRIDAEDGKGGVAQQSFSIRVGPDPDNTAPVIITEAIATGFDTRRYVYDVDATDADSDHLTYFLPDAPSGMFIEPDTGKITWASPVAGTHPIKIRVDDGRGGIEIQSFTLSISNVVPGSIRGSVYLDVDSSGRRKITNPGNLTPDTRVTIGEFGTPNNRFQDNYTAYNLGKPTGVPGILGAMAFKDSETLLVGGGAASGGGALYEVKVIRGQGGHIIGFDDDFDPETPYAANYFADSPYSDAGLVFLPGGALWANSWPPAAIHSIHPGGTPNQTLPLALGGLGIVPSDFPGAGQLKATGLWPNNAFYTVNYSANGTFADGTPRYKVDSTQYETNAGRGPGAFIYAPLSSPEFDTHHLLLAEWNVDEIAAYEVDGNGNPIPATREVFIDNYSGAWGAVLDPVTGDFLFNAWAGYSNIMVVRGLGNPTENEAGLDNWLIYVDQNQNGSRDASEQFTYTDRQGNYSFTLAPGTYRIAQEVQPGWTQTAPTSPRYWDVTVTANTTKFSVDFGNTNAKLAGENVAPAFTSTVPTRPIQTGEKLVYRATATDLNADDLAFDLVLKPEGMAIAPNGAISWRPTAEQIGSHKVIVRVQDGRGGVDLQAFDILVNQGNRAPIFVSPAPEVRPQVGKLFSYQPQVVDLDGDTLTYSLVPNTAKPVTPANVTVNATTGEIRWTPTATGGAFNWVNYPDQPEPWNITIRVTDGKGGEAFQELRLMVDPSAPNRAPSITSTPRATTRYGTPYFYQVEATDLDGDRLSYTLDATSRAKGMTIASGLLSWNPTVANFGNHAIEITVSDGQGGTTRQQYTLSVSDRAINQEPLITSAPTLVTSLDREYRYDLKGFDPDGDAVMWQLVNAPEGMVLDVERGTLRWQPNATQIGAHDVEVRLLDALGYYSGQSFSLKVNGTNLAPTIQSTPATQGAIGQAYSYRVVATDPEQDTIRYSLGKRPAGMTIDAATGMIAWTPQAIGTQQIEVLAIDVYGASTTQVFDVVVGATAINRAPAITSQPVFGAAVGSSYTYQVFANDPDNDRLSYKLDQASLDRGMTIDAQGLVSWASPTAGSFNVVVRVEDGKLGVAQGFTLTSRVNTAPVIRSTPLETATPGIEYAYDVIARDLEGDRLSYSLSQNGIDKGITIDAIGRMRWTPTRSDITTNPLPITVTVSDSVGAKTTQQLNLSVVADTEAPKVRLIALSDVVDVNDTVTFQARATDNVSVAGLKLLVNGQAVELDANGVGTVKATQAGQVLNALAIATDTAGNEGRSTFIVTVTDPTDLEAPIVQLDLSGITDGSITAPTDIRGTVTDRNLASYKLEVALVGIEDWRTMFVGTQGVTHGVLGKFDPSLLENGTYTLRLSAFDTNGAGSVTESTLDVTGELKLGNFRLSFTDLSIPVAGIPIAVTRTYDSLTSNTSDDFGYGWRMEFRDTDLRTSLGRDLLFEELGIRSQAFDERTRVYITLPGGKRESFTFKPKALTALNGAPLGYLAGKLFEPVFTAEKSSTNQLTVEQNHYLIQGTDGRYYGFGNGAKYNPADPLFGKVYVLTTKEGTKYRIDAQTGDLLTLTDTNGNTLTYTDNAITSSTGTSVTFERDAQGRIVKVTDPMGKSIAYTYDAVTGDLVSVSDRDNHTTRLKYDTTDLNRDGQVDRPHYLKEIIDPLGRPAVRTEYDENGRLKQMIDAKGQPITMIYDTDNSLQQVQDQYGNTTTYLYDDRGNVLSEIDAEGKITKRTYDDRNNVLSETIISDRSDDNPNDNVVIGFTTKYTYNAKNDRLTEETGIITRYIYDAQGNERIEETPGQQQQISTYGDRGRILSETNPLGHTTTYQYEGNNLTQTKDAAGQITTYAYDSRTGLLTSFADANQQTTQFRYNNLGYLEWMQDANGNVVQYVNDAIGNRTQEKRTVTKSDGTKQDLMTTWKYSDSGKLEWVKDAEEQTTTYKYDGNGNQIEVIDALNRGTKYRYSKQGQLIETILPDATPTDDRDNLRTIDLYDKGSRRRASIDQGGKMTHFVYDKVGRLVETIYADGRDTLADLVAAIAPGQSLSAIDWTEVTYIDGVPSFLSDNDRSKTEYYNDGLVKAQIDERGNRTQYRYDALGRLVKTIFADKTPNDLSDNPTSTIVYDRAGRKEAEIDALQHKTTFKYDEVGRLVETLFHNNTAIKTGYDSLGRRTSVTDQEGRTTQYRYDALGQLTGVKDAKMEWTEYGYDEAGRMVWQEDARDRRTQYEYDRAGRRTNVILPLMQRSTTVYDAIGNVDYSIDFNGEKTDYTYDAQNRLILKSFVQDGTAIAYTYSPIGLVETITDSRGVTSFRYDHRDRLVSRKDPTGAYTTNGYSIEYGYDAAGNRTSLTTPSGTVNYSFDERNRLEQVKDGADTTTYTYDGVNNLIKTLRPNGVEEIREYNSVNQLELLKNVKRSAGGAEVILTAYDYVLDKVGHRLSVTEKVKNQSDRLVNYDYDELYRLEQEQVTQNGAVTRTTDFTYDTVGNRLSQKETQGTTVTETTYQYDKNDRLEWEKVNGVTSVTYHYDANGNTTEKTEVGKGTTTYSWNQDGRLTDVLTADGQAIGYAYDSEGIRTSSTIDGTTTTYLLDKNRDYAQVLEEYGDGQLQTSYVYGLDLISQERGSQTAFYLVDGLGSTTALTDANGNLTDFYTYLAFGEIEGRSGSTENSYLFAGEQLDEGVGEYYLRDRFYDSDTGRFTRRDIYEGSRAYPLTQNKYLYANANPITWIDPTGFYSQQDGYNVEAAIEAAYATERPVEYPFTTFGRKAKPRFGTSVSPAEWIKPDILNFAGLVPGVMKGKQAGTGLFNEIKPFSLSGVTAGTAQITTYFLALEPYGFVPDVAWHSPANPLRLPKITIGGKPSAVYVFNVAGILFYTDDTSKDMKKKLQTMTYSSVTQALQKTKELLILPSNSSINELGRSNNLVQSANNTITAANFALITALIAASTLTARYGF